jgi:hypothetical protein
MPDKKKIMIHNNAKGKYHPAGQEITVQIEDGKGLSKIITRYDIPLGRTLAVESRHGNIKFKVKSKSSVKGYKPAEFHSWGQGCSTL